MNSFVLCLAQGLFLGRLPLAPGTFGTLLGLPWTAALLATGNIWLFCLGALVGTFTSVWICGQAEKILGQTDPGSVVYDEIVAVPMCFGAWIVFYLLREGQLIPPYLLFGPRTWYWALGVFFLFRFFDILKPWPIRQSQELAGGWGVTVDDLLAAIYVSLTLALLWSVGIRPAI